MQIKFTAEPTGDAVAYFAYEGEKGVEFVGGLDKAGEASFKRAIVSSLTTISRKAENVANTPCLPFSMPKPAHAEILPRSMMPPDT